MHDLVIRNALIADGLGGAPYRADLAVAGITIAKTRENRVRRKPKVS